MKKRQTEGTRRRSRGSTETSASASPPNPGANHRFGYGVLVVLVFACGLAIGLGSSRSLSAAIEHLTTQDDCATRYRFINPHRRCRMLALMPEFETLEVELEAWAQRRRTDTPDEHLSVYWRDLRNGPWFGIREDELFEPASLFKVPLMMAVLKTAREKPGFLDGWVEMGAEMRFPKDHPNDPLRVVPGKRYQVEELLRLMIVHSDNAAAVLLETYLNDKAAPRKPYDAVFDDLGVRTSWAEGEGSQITVKTYASFFRYIYNASYLGREMSDRALALLARSAFKEGIVAGVPRNIDVSHKFGTVNTEGQAANQFHDCGIVYHPKRPYLLCVMTRSTNASRAVEAIRYVSRRVYEEVAKHASP